VREKSEIRIFQRRTIRVVVVLKTEEKPPLRKDRCALLETASLIRRPKSRRGLEHRIKAQVGENVCIFVQ
jgi:hypothetical protein